MRKRSFMFGDCIVCTLSIGGTRPTIGIRQNSKRRLVVCTRIALIRHQKYPLHPRDTASHLCGNKFCINPAHLVWESLAYNVSRNGCHVFDHFATCPHRPACLPVPDMEVVSRMRYEKMRLHVPERLSGTHYGDGNFIRLRSFDSLDSGGLQKLYKMVLSPDTTVQVGNCLMSVRFPASPRPMIVYKNSNWMATHIVLLADKRKPQYPYMNASHLCGESRCVLKEHLVWELPWDNVARDECHGTEDGVATCTHQPRCLPKEPDNLVLDKLHEKFEERRIAKEKSKSNVCTTCNMSFASAHTRRKHEKSQRHRNKLAGKSVTGKRKATGQPATDKPKDKVDK